MTFVIICTVCCIVLFMAGLWKEHESVAAIGMLGLFLSIVLGWGIYGASKDHEIKVQLKPDQYQIVKARGFVEFAVDQELSVKSSDFLTVTSPEKVIVWKVTDVNHYDLPGETYLTLGDK